jgi:glycosidase
MDNRRTYFSVTVSLQKFGIRTMLLSGDVPFEFHILKTAREKYQFDESLFSFNGNVIIADFHSARIFAQKMNDLRDLHNFPERTVRPGQINAMGLIDEINHYILRIYEETVNPGVFSRAVSVAEKGISKESFRQTLIQFTESVPPLDVYRGKITSEHYLNQKAGQKSHSEISLEELILFSISNSNPALDSFRELFDDAELKRNSAYAKLIPVVEQFFSTQKPFGPDNQNIFDLLRAPILASPHSLEGQLAFMKERWGMILSKIFLERMLNAEDLIREDTKIVFHGGGHGPSVVPLYPGTGTADSNGNLLPDIERFTQDIDWMPRVVLLAKNAYVWLDQLSKRYRRSITRLDQIPDEELETLARWNFTGLWLIGIWERSSASRRIKQMTGNPEAVSSAYSVYDYSIAYDLGGEDSFNNLKERAWHRGIRLAGDMVPNHMGLFSKWVIDHPEYFIQSSYSPFPNYRFTGADLSEDPTVQLRIEDGYWSRTDAAVVFQRIDNRNGNVSYFYHGNDGTNMPWNDTAQLNYLKSEVREAVMQTIFHVARKCSIIRFDAAMTLTKKHFQRLWFPKPGTGGDIPSRADHALSNEAFDAVFPHEFWREVVDRINAEMPNTLLLAEAFWLLEGYFVRTLGMHRVYNSAFMHMMMKEENAKYREAIRNTLHYNPEILKRYVNFMSNPDEQTAIAQFGKDDKYFGVALLMVTLPGLPMFAHGQIEGYNEKYGMEYKRAYYDEWPDEHFVRRHEREIFPLMKKRRLFSQVEHFELYDFINANGVVN